MYGSKHNKIGVQIFRILGFLLFVSPIFGQYSSLGTWNIFNVRYVVNDQWSFFGEAQVRSLKVYNRFHYHEYKGGATYRVHPQLSVSLAIGDYDTYREGGNFETPKRNDEFRIWPMVLFNHPLGAFRVEQRYRAEFRFSDAGFRNRFRYRIGLSYPFGKTEKGYTPFVYAINNEVFFGTNAPYFERNRFNTSLTYRLSKETSLVLGYFSQLDYSLNTEVSRDFLQLGVFFEFFARTAK